VPGIGGSGLLTLSADGNRLSGRYTGTGGTSGPFNLTRRTAIARQPAGIGRDNPRPSSTNPQMSAADIMRLLFPPATEQGTTVRPRSNTGGTVPVARLPAARIVPSKEQLALLPIEDLRTFLQRSAEELDSELKTIRTGEAWQEALQTKTLERIAAKKEGELPDEATRELLKELSKKYDEIDKNPDYRMITDMIGFRAVHVALEPLSAEPVEYHRRQLSPSLAELNRSLGQVRTGSGWKKHLQTEELVRLIDKTTSTTDRESLEMMKKILATYDAVSKDPEYEKIATMAGFAMTHQRLDKYVRTSAALASRKVRRTSGKDRTDIAARLEALLDAMKKEKAKEQLETKILRQIVAKSPGRLNPSQVAVLKEIRRQFDESRNDPKANEVVQLAEFDETQEMVDQYLDDVNRVNVFRAQVGMQMLLPGSKEWKSTTSSKDPMGTLKLAVPEEVEIMPLDDVEREDVEIMPLDDVEREDVEIMPLTETNKKGVSTWTTARFSADLNRWSGFVFTPRIDRVVPEAAAGYEPGSTITLVGRFFSVERSQNTIQIMKPLADGSVGVLTDQKPSVASTAGTALEFALPDELNAARLIVRVVVDKDGKPLTSNPVELNVNTPPSAAPTITGISPNPQSPFKTITVNGRNFGDAALVELWFHPKTGHPLPTTAKGNRIAYAQVLSDTQLYSQVPIGLDAGDYVVTCNRGGRLSNWFDFKVSQAPADLSVIDVQAVQTWEYRDPKRALDSNVEEEAKKLKNYWYRVRAKVGNVGSSNYSGGRKIEIRAVPANESANTSVAILAPASVPGLAPGDTFMTEWVETEKVFMGKDFFRSFSATLTPADEAPRNDTLARSFERAD